MTTASTSGARASTVSGAWQPKLGRERLGLFARAIPDGTQQAGAMKIARHVHAHGTETNKANAHL